MFTGLIESVGKVLSVAASAEAIELAISSSFSAQRGESISVNGCCLTVADCDGRRRTRDATLRFQILAETWRRTNFHAARPGARVNLERSLPMNGRLGGHFVTGHIDGVGKIAQWQKRGRDYYLEIAAGNALLRHIAHKGSVALDGISLTVAGVTSRRFHVWIIPHTYRVTALSDRAVGDLVNVETDILAKYVDRLARLQK